MKIFDLEQELLECWRVIEDIDVVTKYFIDSPQWEGMDPKLADALMNKYFSIKELYDLKFQSMWLKFEEVSKEFYQYRKLSGVERDELIQEAFEGE